MNQKLECFDPLPLELDRLCRHALARQHKAATHQACALAFGEDPERWSAYVNHCSPFSTEHILFWLDKWDKSQPGRVIGALIIEIRPGTYILHPTRGPSSLEPYIERIPIAAPPPVRPHELELLGSGSTRVVYRYDENTVVKVPRGEYGEKMNANEARMYIEEVERLERNGIPPENCGFARCWLARLHEDDEIDVLFMEFVIKARHHKSKHKNLRHVDRSQVGYNKAGKLVKFDYGG